MSLVLISILIQLTFLCPHPNYCQCCWQYVMRDEGMLLSSWVRVHALETWTLHLDNTQTHSSPLSRSSFHRKEAQAHRLDWSCDKFWQFPDLCKWRSRELSHTSPGTYKSDWVCALCTGKPSLRVNFMSVSIWVFWNSYILEMYIFFTSSSARKIALFSNISTTLVYAWTMTQFLFHAPAIT